MRGSRLFLEMRGGHRAVLLPSPREGHSIRPRMALGRRPRLPLLARVRGRVPLFLDRRVKTHPSRGGVPPLRGARAPDTRYARVSLPPLALGIRGGGTT